MATRIRSRKRSEQKVAYTAYIPTLFCQICRQWAEDPERRKFDPRLVWTCPVCEGQKDAQNKRSAPTNTETAGREKSPVLEPPRPVQRYCAGHVQHGKHISCEQVGCSLPKLVVTNKKEKITQPSLEYSLEPIPKRGRGRPRKNKEAQ